MTDMLVRLYALPPLQPALDAQAALGIDIRRGLPPEKHHIKAWIEQHFYTYWANECDVSFAHQPPGCFIAVRDNAVIGFACYDAVGRGFFGPTGVSPSERGRGTGAALLLACLHDMWAQGYGYAIIGGVGPAAFYERVVGATVIPDSTPGIYRGMLRGPNDPEV